MKQPLDKLKNWFVTAAKPLQKQYWDWLDSFWHKDDKIPIGSIENLNNIINGKAPVNHTHAIDDITDLANALGTYQQTNEKGQAEGYASLDEDGKVPLEQLPAIDAELFVVVAELQTAPKQENVNKIHLVPLSYTEQNNGYTEYLWKVDTAGWEKFGEINIDLSEYQKKLTAGEGVKIENNIISVNNGVYEEGLFTPSIFSYNPDNVIYTARLGVYTRMGAFATITLALTGEFLTPPFGEMYIIGLPYKAFALSLGSVISAYCTKPIYYYLRTGADHLQIQYSDFGDNPDIQNNKPAIYGEVISNKKFQLAIAITYLIAVPEGV